MKTIAYDIGGTFVKWAILDDEINIIEKGKYETNAHEVMASGIFKDVSNNAISLKEKYPDIEMIAISVPGVVDSETGIVLSATHNIPGSQGMNIKEEIAKWTSIKVSVINDANAATLGEKANGSLKNVSTGVVVTLGTGIGGGLIINNKIHQGHFYSAGEVGRHIVNGKTWEKQFATKGLIDSAKAHLNEENVRGEDLVALTKNDNELLKIYNDWLDGVAQGIANIINIINPEVISLSGGITENDDFKIDEISKLVSKYVLNEILENTKITKSSSGNDAALYGATLFSRS